MILSQTFFNRKQAQKKANHCSKKTRKDKKGNAKKIIKKQTKVQRRWSHVVKRGTSGKKSMWSCGKCLF